jgi:acetyltransferase-like isoleucine patch superfamily enzyme
LLKIKAISECLRARYYGIFYEVGKHCSFGKVVFNTFPKKGSIKIGNSVNIFRYTELCADPGKPIIIGDGTFINQGCIIRPNTTIGKNVCIGPNVSLVTDTHEIGSHEKRAGKLKFPPIVIGDGCWIGIGSIVLGDVKVGSGTVIAAGSLVNRDCDPNCLYGGIPAKLLRKLM